MLKAALKHSTAEDQIRHRTIPMEALQQWAEKLAGFTSEITAIMEEEKEEKHVCPRLLSFPLVTKNIMHITAPSG